MRRFALLIGLVLLAGCTSGPPADETPGPTTPSEPPPPAPRQLLSKEGNNAQCTDVLRDPQTFDFQVDEGFDQLVVEFHASGVGNVGYSITGPNFTKEKSDYNPQNQPCNHAHDGKGDLFEGVSAGNYTITVRNLGIVGWHLSVDEKSSRSNASAGHNHTLA